MGATDKLPPYKVDILPGKARDESVTGSDLVIHLKNPLGPNEKVVAKVAFTVTKDRKPVASGFSLKEAFVESETGAATLIRSFEFDGGGMDKNGSMKF